MRWVPIESLNIVLRMILRSDFEKALFTLPKPESAFVLNFFFKIGESTRVDGLSDVALSTACVGQKHNPEKWAWLA